MDKIICLSSSISSSSCPGLHTSLSLSGTHNSFTEQDIIPRLTIIHFIEWVSDCSSSSVFPFGQFDRWRSSADSVELGALNCLKIISQLAINCWNYMVLLILDLSQLWPSIQYDAPFLSDQTTYSLHCCRDFDLIAADWIGLWATAWYYSGNELMVVVRPLRLSAFRYQHSPQVAQSSSSSVYFML